MDDSTSCANLMTAPSESKNNRFFALDTGKLAYAFSEHVAISFLIVPTRTYPDHITLAQSTPSPSLPSKQAKLTCENKAYSSLGICELFVAFHTLS